MEIWVWIITPLTGALIGYSTNWLAIRMLFRPHGEKRVFGLRLPFTPGLIPKNKARLAKKMGEAVGTRVLTAEILTRELAASPLWAGIQNMSLREMFAQWGLEAPEIYATRGIAALRARMLNPAEADGFSARLITAAKGTLRAKLPDAAKHLHQWAAHQPQMNAYFEGLTEQMVLNYFGKLIGAFVDHKKIYAGIKEGLFEYLAREENLASLADKLDESMDRFADGGGTWRLWANHLPDDAELAVKAVEWVESALKHAGEAKKTAVLRVFEQAAGLMATHMDVQGMMERRIGDFSAADMEELVLSVVRREMHIIMALGGLIGFFIGFVPLLMR
jgi:uncharacterized membrane protein YheB (UPF0754 family)